MVVVLIVLEVFILILLQIVIFLIEVLVTLDVVRVDMSSVAVPFGASFPVHVSGTYLSTKAREFDACGLLRTTKYI